MELRKSYDKKLLTLAWALALAFLMVVMCHRGGLSASLSDPQKKKTVYQMYARYKQDFPEVVDITPREAMRLLAQKKKVVLVDVRSPKEQQVSMLPGAVTQDEFLRNLDQYRDHVIIGYCTISYRSGKLARKLRQQGITMRNLQGGLLAWLHEGGRVHSQGVETDKVHVYGKKWDLAPTRYKTVKYLISLW
jgi:sodium/bile acid cotransporter 7